MSKMYTIQITEPKHLYVGIHANSMYEALDKARDAYDNGNYVDFNWDDDPFEAEFHVIGEDDDEEESA